MRSFTARDSRLPNSLNSVGKSAFADCRKLTYVTFPHSLGDVGDTAFEGCIALTSVDFRPMSSPALIAWAVGSSRNRVNWELTSVMRLRNVLSLITLLALEPRDAVYVLDPDGSRGVFMDCPCGYPYSGGYESGEISSPVCDEFYSRYYSR